ncbi:MAG: family 20 glycosylhydrolase [Opitutaceae bacterium]
MILSLPPIFALLALIGAALTPTVVRGAADRPAAAGFTPAETKAFPVQALMIMFPPPEALDDFVAFVRRDLPREGVTHLILQIDYGYQFKSRPEMAGAVSEADVKSVVAACREAGVKLIPLVNCLGHQSWKQTTHRLLTVYPEFDETPGLYPENEDIYCRSYCPNHPEVHAVVFDLLKEILDVFEADALHAGLDEVFLIAEDACPRCRGADPAEVFAQEVRTLRNFLHAQGARMWMWGDRFIDGRTTGIGKWEASMNNTHRAIDLVPRDIVICDWHYESTPPTAAYFALKGFEVVLCSWNRPAVAVAQADQIAGLRGANIGNKIGSRLLGVMSTSWGAADKFLSGYAAAKAGDGPADPEAAENFIQLFAHLRTLERPEAGEDPTERTR